MKACLAGVVLSLGICTSVWGEATIAPSLEREAKKGERGKTLPVPKYVDPNTIPVSHELKEALKSKESAWEFLIDPETPNDQRIACAFQWSRNFSAEILPKLVRAIHDLEKERALHNWGLERNPFDSRGPYRTKLSADVPPSQRKRTILGRTWIVPDERMEYPLDENETSTPWPLQVETALSRLFVWSSPHSQQQADPWLAAAMTMPRTTDEEAKLFYEATNRSTYYFGAPHIAAWRDIALNPEFPDAAFSVCFELPLAIRLWREEERRYLGRAAYIDLLKTCPHPRAWQYIAGGLSHLRGLRTEKHPSFPYPLPATEVMLVSRMAISAEDKNEQERLHLAFIVCGTIDEPPFVYDQKREPEPQQTSALLKQFREWYEMNEERLEEAARLEEPFLQKARETLAESKIRAVSTGVATEHLRQQYVDAKTPQDSQEAKAECPLDTVTQTSSIPAPSATVTMEMHEEWKDVTVELHRVGEQQSQIVDAKRAVFAVNRKSRDSRIPVVAFIAPTSGRPWAGLEQDVYVEEPTQIIGFRILGERLDWASSLLKSTVADEPRPKTMDDLLETFSHDVTPLDLRNAAVPFDTEELAARATQLKPFVKNPWMFTNGPFSSQIGIPKIVDAEMCGRITIKVEITDQTEQFHAALWINTTSRDVVEIREQTWDSQHPLERAGASTEELRQQYVNAKTHEEWLVAKKAWIADLQKRYEGIDATVIAPAADEHGARFNRLMIEWNPIHFSADDLKSIAGKPTRESEESLEYRFDNGYGGTLWEFGLDAGVIRSLSYYGLY
ncbi:MAG: hypothetical protein WEB58_00680 [Planctomycetaceae bacterium]